MVILKKGKTPTEIWKANKWRIDLREYTREFSKKFKENKKIEVFPGNIYALKYISETSITDKYHVTPVIISFGRFKDDLGKVFTRGINLFYLSTTQKLEILEDIHPFQKFTSIKRVPDIVKIHEKWKNITPYAIKDFEERRIESISLVINEEWGMIPLLQQQLYGNFNIVSLNESYKKENKIQAKYKVSKKSNKAFKEKEEELEDEISLETQIENFNLDDDDI